MKIIEKTITLEDIEEPLVIVPFSDIHFGATEVNKTRFHNLIEWIKNKPNCFAIGLGDYCDCIVMNDKRFDIKSIDPYFMKDLDNLPIAQLNYLKQSLEPIKDKVLCLLPGNHEDKFRLQHSLDVLSEMNREGYTIGDYMTFLRVKFNREQFHTTPIIFWLHHGWFGSRKPGAKVNQLVDVASTYEADVYLAAHSHDLFNISIDRISIGASSSQVIKHKKIFGNTGTFLETITNSGSSYAEKKAYPVSKIGTLRFDIYPKHKPRPDIHVRV